MSSSDNDVSMCYGNNVILSNGNNVFMKMAIICLMMSQCPFCIFLFPIIIIMSYVCDSDAFDATFYSDFGGAVGGAVGGWWCSGNSDNAFPINI